VAADPARRAVTVARGLFAALVASAAVACSRGEPATILVVTLDSVRADALTFRDPVASPRLTELARRGTVFTQAISGSSWTLPTHVQLFTGQAPVLHGVQHDATAIDPVAATWPRLLADAGWNGFGYYTGWYLAKDFGYAPGFAVYENAMTGGERVERDFMRLVREGRMDEARNVFGTRDVASHRDITSPTVVQRARAGLDAAPRGSDVFLFAHLFDPHYDYIPPPPWNRVFDPDYDGPIDGRDFYLNKSIYDPDAEPRRRISDRDLAHIVALYRGEIGWTDQHVGELLDLLEERGRLANALIVVTADHGEEFFEHGGRGHRHTLFDEQLRIPLLLVDGRRASSLPHSGAQVTLSDIAPTVLSWAGLAVPPAMSGRSLLPALEDPNFASRPAVASLVHHRPRRDGTMAIRMLDVWRMPDSKLIRSLELADGELTVTDVAWYDLSKDPGEHAPVGDLSHPSLVRAWDALEVEYARLRAIHRSIPHSPLELRRTRFHAMMGDEAAKSELAALGYLDGQAADADLAPFGMGPPAPIPLDSVVRRPRRTANPR
jgi:arylsulfatase A-like enzyme